jgi:hypothetical protein
MLIRGASTQIRHMQKAVGQMNLGLYHVVAAIPGVTGMRIILAITEGFCCATFDFVTSARRTTAQSYRTHRQNPLPCLSSLDG